MIRLLNGANILTDSIEQAGEIGGTVVEKFRREEIGRIVDRAVDFKPRSQTCRSNVKLPCRFLKREELRALPSSE